MSGNSVWALREDSAGNIWAGTKNGILNCYNPFTGKFKSLDLEPGSAQENSITAIYQDRNQYLWIGTYRKGLYRLDPAKEKIDHWEHRPDVPNSLSNNYISAVVEDRKGDFWIGTYNGLNKFNPKDPGAGFKRYYHTAGNQDCLSDNVIWNISRSKSDPNSFWIGTANGLTRLQTDKEIFSQIIFPNPDKIQFGRSAGSVIEETAGKDKFLWVDSFAGLLRFNLITRRMERFISVENNSSGLTNNHINRMISDRSGVLWLGTEVGLNYFSKKSIKFNNSLSGKYRLINPYNYSIKNIKASAKTSDGRLWFGSENGLFYSNIIDNNNEVRNRSGNDIEIKKYSKFEGINIWSLYPGSSDELLIGTYGSGTFRLNVKTGKAVSISAYDKRRKIPAVNYSKVVFKDCNDNIWIGFWGLGLARFNPRTHEYKTWLSDAADPYSLSHNDVWAIHQDKYKRIWIGTNGGGLNLFLDSANGKFIRWVPDANKPGSLSSSSIYTIFEAANSGLYGETTLWIGTNTGLNKFLIKNSSQNVGFSVSISSYTVEDGLADNSVKTVLQDEKGDLWLGTGSGISLFDIKKNKFINFDETDGILGTDFNFSSACKISNGIIFIGSTSGLNYFDPDDIVQSQYKPPVFITDFQIFNKSVPAGENSPLARPVLFTREIIIPYTQNVFSFQIAALDYNSSRSIRYKYKMEGFDNNWVNSGTRRFITYTNLNPGRYIFKMRSTNSDGIWNETFNSIKIIITPPWWQTGWAIGFYFTVFILGIWGIIKFQSNRTKLHAELRMREFETRHFREIEKMKSRFFANLSHEFRTPLMLIKGPLEQLIYGKIKGNVFEYYRMAFRNTENLQHLIDQLLELSQLEAESIPLNLKKHNLVPLLQGFSNVFIPLAEQKKIGFSFKSAEENIYAVIDKDKFEKIMNNLLSNAFKFTNEKGNITVSLSVEAGDGLSSAVISISDSGIGIPEEYQSKIFDRFFQVDDSSRRNYGGSGIGLALVKELSALLKWDISVNSETGKGTLFYIRIPLEKDYMNNNSAGQKETPADISFVKDVTSKEKISGTAVSNITASGSLADRSSKILIVEDSADVRKYLSGLLETLYKIEEAENAEEGIKAAINCMPDLILSDIMMPGMDGIEFCRSIKTNWETSHIPVVLLTAKAAQESRIEGLETGADDYITKPFSYLELSARIKNLLDQRRLLKEKFSKEINIRPESISSNLHDKEFLEKILKFIEENLHNEELDSGLLAENMFVSRTQLHRKLQAITGHAPGEFIRIFKLKRAAQKIIENRLSITQIAYEVGFNSPAQFTRAFQKYFNCLPSEFKYNN